jgi:hypothetical protein
VVLSGSTSVQNGFNWVRYPDLAHYIVFDEEQQRARFTACAYAVLPRVTDHLAE